MVSDEDWRKAPDWDKITELKHPCDCPSSCERKVVGCGYDGTYDWGVFQVKNTRTGFKRYYR